MGWFWAAERAVTSVPAPTAANLNASSPPSCPMHRPQDPEPPNKPISLQTCPYPQQSNSTSSITNDKSLPSSSCPVRSEPKSSLNPLNWMPNNLSNSPAAEQTVILPLERERSTIPKGDGSGKNWEYPSPQQMYHALLRKGFSDGPDGVEPMVAVHNFLNEGTWAEIVEWERRFSPGIVHGWRESLRGDAPPVPAHSSDRPDSSLFGTQDSLPAPQLSRFMGRPGVLTPKARLLQTAAWAFPKHFNSEPPFDRHDWFVQRTLPDGSTTDVRYVIDYYSGSPDSDAMPVFFLDVRPAIDSPSAAAARFIRFAGDLWYRGSGASARGQPQAQQSDYI